VNFVENLINFAENLARIAFIMWTNVSHGTEMGEQWKIA
jgi:hypothetical protein